MCLIKNSVQYSARECYYNTLVFKSLCSDNSSEYTDFKYYKGVLNKEDLFIQNNERLNQDNEQRGCENGSVSYGFHFRSNTGRFHKDEKKHLFLVPKGSLVWYGFENYETGCFGGVSNQIIYLGRNNWFNRLYYKWVYKAIIL